MPTFFDPKTLTDSQRTRWDWAMQEYERVQKRNIDRQIAQMSRSQRNDLLHALNLADGDDALLRSRLLLLQSVMGGGAGDPKSALFARLLDGKPALDTAPPTTYGYPWYAVVEEARSFDVQVGPVTNFQTDALDDTALSVNNCAWHIEHATETARRLLKLQTQLSNDPEAVSVSAVLQAYRDEPQFSLSYGAYSGFSLDLRYVQSQVNRGYALQKIRVQQAETDTVHSDRAVCGNVFDTKSLLIDGRIGAVVRKGEHPLYQLARLRGEILEKVPLADLFEEDTRADLTERIARFEADPALDDIVEVTHKSWALARSG